jgi:hypothetical protein
LIYQAALKAGSRLGTPTSLSTGSLVLVVCGFSVSSQ